MLRCASFSERSINQVTFRCVLSATVVFPTSGRGIGLSHTSVPSMNVTCVCFSSRVLSSLLHSCHRNCQCYHRVYQTVINYRLLSTSGYMPRTNRKEVRHLRRSQDVVPADSAWVHFLVLTFRRVCPTFLSAWNVIHCHSFAQIDWQEAMLCYFVACRFLAL